MLALWEYFWDQADWIPATPIIGVITFQEERLRSARLIGGALTVTAMSKESLTNARAEDEDLES